MRTTHSVTTPFPDLPPAFDGAGGASLARRIVASPVGPLTLVASDLGLVAVLWDGDDPARVRLGPSHEAPHHAVLSAAERQLGEYFSSGRKSFDVPFDMRGTAFQIDVWTALLAIPFGETRTYGGLARALGLAPGAARAVGGANRANPLSILVPCHRVIGSSGRLTGFAGGLPTKSFLLQHEGVRLFGT